jgi:hypothetical protein
VHVEEVAMITTEDRVEETLIEAPATASPPDTRTWLAQPISTGAAVMLGATWYVLYSIGFAVEPRTDAPQPLFADVLGIAGLGLLALMVVGLAVRRRWGTLAALGGSGLFLAQVVACPTTGHHPIGAWWFVQMTCAVALVAASGYALRKA